MPDPTPNPTPIRILICEDQTLMREGLRTVLDLEPGFRVVGEAADGAEVVRLAERLRPEIVLMDVRMPQQNGVQATAAITARGLPCRVIILTTFDYEDYVFDGIKAGAVGYLLKDTPAAELAATIRLVAAGDSFIQPTVATRLLAEFGRRSGSAPELDDLPAPADTTPPRASAVEPPRKDAAAALEQLSQREGDVLRLLAQGASNRAIAEQLVLAEGTVKNYVSNILAKLHANNRTQAASLARERGLI
jgi:two-component system, NarL family, response regulator DegU